MENEIWKEIPGYEGLYEVSNLGKVRSIKWRGGYKTHEIFHATRPSGYVEVSLTKNKKVAYRRVHRLVAEAFVTNPENKPFIDHIDCDRGNNRADNLRWCTSKENANNPITRTRQSAAQVEQMRMKWEKGCCDRVKKPVVQYSLDGELVREFESSAAASRYTGLSPKGISDCCALHERRFGGFIWIYPGDEALLPALIERNKLPKGIRVKVHWDSGRTIVYDSVNRAAKELYTTNRTIRQSKTKRLRGFSWELLNTKTIYSITDK